MADFVAFASADDARLVLDTARRIKASGLLNRIGGSVEDRPIEQPIYWVNTTGVTIPPYSCLTASSLVTNDTRDYFTVSSQDFMDATGASPILFSTGEEVPSEGMSIAQPGPVYKVNADLGQPPLVHNSGFATYAPVVNSYKLSARTGGMFAVAPIESLSGQNAGQDYNAKAIRIPHGLFIFKNRNIGTGVANIHWLDPNALPTGKSATVSDGLNIFGIDVLEGFCMLSGGSFTIIQAPCPG